MAAEHLRVLGNDVSDKTHVFDHLVRRTFHEVTAASDKDGVASEDTSVDVSCHLVASVDLVSRVFLVFVHTLRLLKLEEHMAACVARSMIADNLDIVHLEDLVVLEASRGSLHFVDSAAQDMNTREHALHRVVASGMIAMVMRRQDRSRRHSDSICLHKGRDVLGLAHIDENTRLGGEVLSDIVASVVI